MSTKNSNHPDLLDQLHIGVFEADKDWNFQYTNLEWQYMTGLTGEESQGMGWLQAIFPHDLELFAENVGRAKDEKINLNQQFRITHPSGETRVVQFRATPLLDEEGELKGFTGTVMDITAEKIHCQRLAHQLEERWHFALENATDGFRDWNLETGEVFYSESYRGMLGYKPKELTGTPEEWGTLIHPENRDHVYRELQRHLNGETPFYHCEYTMVTKSGESVRVLERGKVIEWNEEKKPTRFISTFKNINERRVIKERFYNAFNEAPTGIAILDLDGKFMEANQSWCQLLGYDPKELGTFTFGGITATEDIEREITVMRKLLLGENWNLHMRKHYIAKSGRLVPVTQHMSLVRDESGRPAYFILQIQPVIHRQAHIQPVHEAEEANASSTLMVGSSHFSEPVVTGSHPYDLKGLKILVVEDNRLNLQLACRFISKWSGVVDEAANGRIALEKAKQQKYDIILMDLQMPEMDGQEATQRIREFDRNTPIIALTASSTTDVRKLASEAGMNDVITKPFQPVDFYKKLQYYIQR